MNSHKRKFSSYLALFLTWTLVSKGGARKIGKKDGKNLKSPKIFANVKSILNRQIFLLFSKLI